MILTTFLLFPIIMNYFSPYVIIDGASQGVVNGSFIVFGAMFLVCIALANQRRVELPSARGVPTDWSRIAKTSRTNRMNESIHRWAYTLLITGSVLITPIVGVFGPFNNGDGTAPFAREYFLPAGFVFGTVWAINYLGLAAYGIWQVLPGQRANQRVRSALPWLAATAVGNVLWIAFAGSPDTVPWTVPT